MTLRSALLLAFGLALPALVHAAPALPIGAREIDAAVARLVARYGPAEEALYRRGASQVAARWWERDGDAAAFVAFCEEGWIAEPAERDRAFARLQQVLEQVDGRLHEIRREVTTPLDLDTGPVTPLDRRLADLDLQAHVDEDLYGSKAAFLALLHFPVFTLPEKLAQGPGWDRAAWARARLMDRFAMRVPAEVSQEVTRAFTAADQYIAGYYVRMDRLAGPGGERLFPEGMRLISHWNLRDELKSRYALGARGLPHQRTIAKVMERIVRQEIPRAAIDNGTATWDPFANTLDGTPAEREPDTRYATLLDVFRATRKVDPYAPTAPTYVRRKFEVDRQMPAAEVEALLVSVLDAPEVRDLAKIVARRLGRPLEPFDLWYAGFAGKGTVPEDTLNALVRERYPTVAAFQADLPRILTGLGFTPEKARWLAERIVVDPSRGAGHAMGAVRREDKAHLRTRIPQGGMDYKGYNIAVHELGHNVEQTFSLQGIDHWALNGVPNNAFTEALAFVFQARDLELLGLPGAAEEARASEALSTLWATYEIAGVGLVDMKVWDWMEAHPDATPAQLREATLAVAREVWNLHYAPVFGVRDVELLAIYSHMISNGLYLPDYALGHLIAFQVAAKLRAGDFGAEFERVSRQGRLTPDAWMRGAVGGPVSSRALLEEARRALASTASN